MGFRRHHVLAQTHTNVYHEDGTLHSTVQNCNAAPVVPPTTKPMTALGDDDLPSDYDGWLEYAAYQNNVGFRSFLGTFSVPDTPAATPDVLYLFTGLQNIEYVLCVRACACVRVCIIIVGFVID